MIGHGSKFGRKKEEAIAALLSQRNTEEAARVTGVGTTTMSRWLKLPEFQEAYRKARREAVEQAGARLQQATGAAGVTILKLMTDPNVAPAVRLRAAEFVFEYAVKVFEVEEIEKRVAELEEAVKQVRPSTHHRELV